MSVKLGSVASTTERSEEEVRKWQQDFKDRRNESGRPLLNALQYEMVLYIADQVCIEMRAKAANNYDNAQPLRWSMHGGPGTGDRMLSKSLKHNYLKTYQSITLHKKSTL